MATITNEWIIFPKEQPAFKKKFVFLRRVSCMTCLERNGLYSYVEASHIDGLFRDSSKCKCILKGDDFDISL